MVQGNSLMSSEQTMFAEANKSADQGIFDPKDNQERQTMYQYRRRNNQTLATVNEDGPSCMLFNVVSKKEKGNEKNRRHLNNKRDQLKSMIKQESAKKHSNF